MALVANLYSTTDKLLYLILRAQLGNPVDMPEIDEPQPPFLGNIEKLLYELLQAVKAGSSGGGSLPENFVLQATGQSTTQVMSQKAVTEQFLPIQRNGLVLTFDRDAYYGTNLVPESGNTITLAVSGHNPGVVATIFHAAAAMPAIPESVEIVNGNYLNNSLNIIKLERYSASLIIGTILQ